MEIKCKDCVFEEDMKKLLAGEYVGWACTQPHPCTTCKRFPREPQEYTDNFLTILSRVIGGK